MQQTKFNLATARKLSTRLGHDARADGGRRTVVLNPSCVIISRRVDGMKMHLYVPVDHFEKVAIVGEERPDGAFYRISLVHRDPELCVVLKESRDLPAVLEAWSEWSAFFAAPALSDRSARPSADAEPPGRGADAAGELPSLPPPRPFLKRRARRGREPRRTVRAITMSND